MSDYKTVRWGILGPGAIAKQFARGLAVLPDAPLVAVGSREQSKAEAFADEFGAKNRHGSYEALVADPEVDVVYVATPHPFHKDNTLLALRAGKHVLCEKPFTINAKELGELVHVAREKKLFLMEAMWTRFFPAMQKLRELVKAGEIGEVRMVQADFGFRASINPEGRLFDLNLGGGALLDVGVYPISFASMLLGSPNKVRGIAHIGPTGVDEQASMLLGYPSGAMAVLCTAVRTNTSHVAIVNGTEGRITVPTSWWKPERLIVERNGKEPETIELPFEGTGYNYQAAEVASCLREGRRESKIMPLAESVSIMEVMDDLRILWQLKYPME